MSIQNVKLLILADDFTGAMDTAVQLSKKGVRTVVYTAEELSCSLNDGSKMASIEPEMFEVLSVNMNYRHISPDEARVKLKKVLSKYMSIPFIYLKTDSILRGNLSSLFASALEVLQTDIFFAPAYPQVGRTTVQGRQMDQGIPIEKTRFAEDPLNPVKSSYVPDILNQNYEVPVKLLSFSERDSQGNFGINMTPDSNEKSKSVYIFDADCEFQLQQLAKILKAQNHLRVCAGCAGFMEALSDVLFPFFKDVGESVKRKPEGKDLPVLFISCSAQPITRKQIIYARANGFPVEKIQKRGLSACNQREIEQFADEARFCLREYLSQGRSVIFATNVDDEDFIESVSDGFHDRLLEFLGLVAEKLVDDGCRNIAVFGGDGAYAIMKKLGCECIILGDEIQPGVPFSQLWMEPKVEMVSKSGGLGEENVVLAIEKAIRG